MSTQPAAGVERPATVFSAAQAAEAFVSGRWSVATHPDAELSISRRDLLALLAAAAGEGLNAMAEASQWSTLDSDVYLHLSRAAGIVGVLRVTGEAHEITPIDVAVTADVIAEHISAARAIVDHAVTRITAVLHANRP